MGTFSFDSTTDDVLEGVDLTGKRIVVTGASTGLGEETTRALAAHGASVTMAVRDLPKATAARDRILATVPGADLELAEIELDSLASIRAFAAAFLATHDHIDVLINNAGVMACPQIATQDGFELQFGTNHLGHFLLTVLLLPALRAGAPSRVVALTSSGHRISDVSLDDWNFEHTTYEPWTAYGRSKTANALFALELDRREAANGVRAFSVHPGGIQTELGRHLTPEAIATLMAQMDPDSGFRFKNIPQGAATSCLVATAPGLEADGGRYFEDCGVAEPTDHPTARVGVRGYAQDPDRAAALWTLSERLVGLA